MFLHELLQLLPEIFQKKTDTPFTYIHNLAKTSSSHRQHASSCYRHAQLHNILSHSIFQLIYLLTYNHTIYLQYISNFSIFFFFMDSLTFSLSTLWHNVKFTVGFRMTLMQQNTSKAQHLLHHHSLEFSSCSPCRCWMANSNLTFIIFFKSRTLLC